MKSIRIHKVDLSYVDGAYIWGVGNAIETAKESAVDIDTDAGLQGVGEFTPCGENYMVAHCHAVWACQDMITIDIAGGRGHRNTDGHLHLPELPGLCLNPDGAALSDPVVRCA